VEAVTPGKTAKPPVALLALAGQALQPLTGLPKVRSGQPASGTAPFSAEAAVN
jgi:hypothetical protein